MRCYRWLLVGILLGTGCAQAAPPRAERLQLSALENAVLQELNRARTDPQAYSVVVERTRTSYTGKEVRRPGRPVLTMREGLPAVDEAIQFLRHARPVRDLQASRGLSLGARDHLRDQGKRGRFGHRGSDGSQPWDRANRYGRWLQMMGENISYGINMQDAQEVVMSFIVDDAVPDRGHRQHLFQAAYRVVGVACGAHARAHAMCVVVFAEGYIEQGQDGKN